MPLKKLLLKAGVNKENTRYTNENGWYDSQWVRFRQGTPEKIGGWTRISVNTFLGICRSLWNWVTLTGYNLLGVGTDKKFYISQGGAYYDITPISFIHTLTNPFATNTATNTGTTTTVTVTDITGGFAVGNYVVFNPTVTVGGVSIGGEYEIKTAPSSTTYTITATGTAASTTSGGGTVYAMYELPIGAATVIAQVGWGAGGWGLGTWGNGEPSTSSSDFLRLWSQSNFGEDLIYASVGGKIYYWNATQGVVPVTATITIASPGVVTATTGYSNGDAIVLNTTGALPTGLTPGTVYYVVNASGSTFSLAATYGGTAITTSGAQSGTHTISIRGIPVSSLGGASDVPTVQNFIFVADISRFVFAFGCNEYGSTVQDPMLIRWGDQESVVNWTPSATNQAGSVRLSHGSKLVACIQTRQEIVVFTDSTVYSLQYLGPPVVWGTQILGDNISIVGLNGVAQSAGVVYWMGTDKFYKYDGRVQTLRCDLRQYIYSDINLDQSELFFAGTNEGFNEVWWFYCSANSNTIDRYVVYNYVENNGEGIWFYGSLARTAWLDSGLQSAPIAATYVNNIVSHETGLDDNSGDNPAPIYTLISSAEFDIDDGDKFGFVWRMLPDITFRGSTTASPTGTMTLIPMQNSGSGYNNPISQGGNPDASVTRTATAPIEQFTGQVYVRVRGRQMIIKFENEQLGSQWQLGSPRIDIKTDGRRGNTG